MIGEAFSKTNTTFGYCVYLKDACCRRCWSGLTKCFYVSSIALDALRRGYSFAFGEKLKSAVVVSTYERRRGCTTYHCTVQWMILHGNRRWRRPPPASPPPSPLSPSFVIDDRMHYQGIDYFSSFAVRSRTSNTPCVAFCSTRATVEHTFFFFELAG